MLESGVPELRDFEASGWFGFYGPADLPAAEVQRLNAAINRVLRRPEVAQALQAQGASVLGGTPEQFAAHNRRDVERWGALVRRLGVRVD
jgi:tripartite-type tricarboxylate transporter receptor subunit TctC